jgi:hypothetical protein
METWVSGGGSSRETAAWERRLTSRLAVDSARLTIQRVVTLHHRVLGSPKISGLVVSSGSVWARLADKQPTSGWRCCATLPLSVNNIAAEVSSGKSDQLTRAPVASARSTSRARLTAQLYWGSASWGATVEIRAAMTLLPPT